VYNIGSGIGRNNMDVLNEIRPYAQSSGYEIEVNILPYRKFDVPINVLESEKLRRVSNWQPQISFDQGIKLTWEAALSKARKE
jgi:UDP-glucose 4-epimerase